MNALGGHGDGLQAGGAEAVDGHGRDLFGQSGAQGSDAGNVHSLFCFRHGAAEDDILDFVRIELRDAVERAFDSDRREFVGPGGAESAFVGAPYGRANGRDEDDFTHRMLLYRT